MINANINGNQPFTYRMQAATARAAMFPRLEQLWRERLPQIDSQIVDFYRGTPEIGAGMAQLQYGITDWFASQALDPQTRTELRRLEQDPEFLRAHLEERISQLREAGRLAHSIYSPLVAPKLQQRRLPLPKGFPGDGGQPVERHLGAAGAEVLRDRRY